MIFEAETVQDGYVIYLNNKALRHYEVVELLNRMNKVLRASRSLEEIFRAILYRMNQGQ